VSPLVALPRHAAELGGLDLFARLDDSATGALADEARLDAVIARFREGVRTSLKNPARVYGWHTQVMFGQVVRALGAVVLLTEEDQGTTWARTSDQINPGDYRAVLADGRNLSIEVKNHPVQDVDRPFKMPKANLAGLVRYAALTGGTPRVAIYWSVPGLWFLVDPAQFTLRGDKAVLDMRVAMAESEMADLGDVMIGTVPPLEFDLAVHELGDRRPTGRATARTTLQIDGVSVSAGGRELKGAAERRLAFYLMWNGKWPETEHDDSEDGRLTHHRFRYEPEEWPREQGFAIIGFYSELFARSFWFQTSDEGVVTKLTADLDPSRQGFVIPDDYQSEELPLWRIRLRPRAQSRGA
jgi:Holliday junction resolvase